MIFETENIEFKLQPTDAIYKEVIAFANTNGGTVYIGIDDNGNVAGLDDVDDSYTKITNGIRDAIQPDVTMFIKYAIQDNKVVKITIGEGSSKPYYLKSKGLKPSGVYIRQGATSVQASYEQIRKMIKDSDGDIFEEMRSLNQDLTFNEAKNAFDRYNIEFSKEKFRNLGITDSSDSLYTNLALLLSDQCTHTIKVAVFKDVMNTEFSDSKEFSGSIFKQLDNVFSYLRLCNKTVATFKGLERTEKSDYPEAALREALLNAIVHRDYSFSGSIIINVNEKEIEFVSIGGLVPGLSPDDIRNGISQPRNKRLANVFYRLHLIEAYGTGIRRIYSLYNKVAVQPRIEVTSNSFKMILPNINYATENSEVTNTFKVVTPQMKIILDFIEEKGSVTEPEIQDLLNVKKTRAYTIAKEMVNGKLLYSEGKAENKRYYKC